MLWTCVAASGKGSNSLMDGRMDSITCQHIVEAKITPFVQNMKMKRGWFLQQDNDSKRTLKSTKDYLNRVMVKVMPWLSQSSNLYVIENLQINLRGECMQDDPISNSSDRTRPDFCKEE